MCFLNTPVEVIILNTIQGVVGLLPFFLLNAIFDFVCYNIQGPKLHWMVAENDNESALRAEDLIPSAT